jgi:hypothetical protein
MEFAGATKRKLKTGEKDAVVFPLLMTNVAGSLFVFL